MLATLPDDTTAAIAPRRSSALLHALRPTTWRHALAIDFSRAGFAIPLRVGIAVGLMLVIGGLVGRGDIAGFAALGALVSAFGRPDPYPVRLRRLIALGVGMTAATSVGGLVGVWQANMAVEIVVISLLAGASSLFIGALRVVGPGAVVFVFAGAAAAGAVHDARMLLTVVVATAIGAVCGVGASLAPWPIDVLRGRTGSSAPTIRHESVWRSLARCTDPTLLIIAGRILVAAAASAVIAAAAGLDHPMWAAMGAMAALQGVTYHVTVTRGIARLLGNVAGALIAAGLLAVPLGYWGAVVAIMVFQTLAEIFATVNYALCSTAVTPMALLLTALGAGLTPEVALDRVLDTMVGIVVGIIVGALTIATDDVLPGHSHHDAA